MIVMNTSIYDKTAKGREEIATRKYQLAPRLRTLLVLVDGHKPEEELLRNVAGLGLTVNALQDLLAQELIVLTTSFGDAVLPGARVGDDFLLAHAQALRAGHGGDCIGLVASTSNSRSCSSWRVRRFSSLLSML